MSERIVNDPSLHGWVEENGKWVWEGGAATGHIEDGTVQGQITTWDVDKTEWTPDSSILTDRAGNVTFKVGTTSFDTTASHWMVGTEDNQHIIIHGGDGRKTDGGLAVFRGVNDPAGGSSVELHSGGSPSLVLDSSGKATFSGTVDAAGFTVNGQPISGDHSGNNLVIENPLSPENEKKWRFNVNQQSGRLRIQNLNDDDSIKQADFIRFNQDNSIAAVGNITATDFIATSDERAKDNITTAPVGLIDSLKGREWDWKESGEKGSGVVAQELEQVLPHLVHEDDDGMKSVSYNGLIAYLIEEIKDLKAQVSALK